MNKIIIIQQIWCFLRQRLTCYLAYKSELGFSVSDQFNPVDRTYGHRTTFCKYVICTVT